MSPSSTSSEATALASQLPFALWSRLRPLSHHSACVDNKVTMTFKSGGEKGALDIIHPKMNIDIIWGWKMTEIRKTGGYVPSQTLKVRYCRNIQGRC